MHQQAIQPQLQDKKFSFCSLYYSFFRFDFPLSNRYEIIKTEKFTFAISKAVWRAIDKGRQDISIRPGESIPADGMVFDGSAEVDESMLTGGQEPVLKKKDDMVSSGTSNLNGVLKISVTRTGKNSTVSQIYELIQRAISGRAKVQRIADVFSAIFVPVVIAAALASGLFWYFYLNSTGFALPLEIAVLAFVSVVVIACPCAIGLAGPITLLISSNYASENGIIIKNTSALDRLSQVVVNEYNVTAFPCYIRT